MENQDNNENRHTTDGLETTTNLASRASMHPFTRDNLVGFKGRMNRLDYAILWLAVFVGGWLIYKQTGLNPIVTAFQAMSDPDSLAEKQKIFGFILLFSTLGGAYVSVKRFQDIGYSGKMALIFLTPLLPLGIFSLILAFVILVLKGILLFAPGNPDTNEFGLPPAPNNRNKILLLFILLFAIFMLYSSFASEAMPIVQPMLEEMMEQAGG